MKKITKILSSVLAVSMVLSCFAMNAFAIKQARTYTVKVSKATELVAGDKITVEVIADTLLHSFNAGYTLYFDPNVFSIDTASGGMGKPKKYVDTTWNSTIKNAETVTGWYWGTSPTSNQNAEEGWITYGWSGNTEAGAGVEAENNQTNYVIGKFYLTVKDTAPNGETQITVDGKTYGFGESVADTMTYVPATLSVGAAKTDVVIDDVTEYTYSGEYDDNGVAKKYAGFTTSFTVGENNNEVVALNITGTKTKRVDLNTKVTSGTCNVMINILGVPADATLGTITVAPLAK